MSGARNAEADALLASLTIEQLQAGLKLGLEKLAVNDAQEAEYAESAHSDVGHPGRHPGKQTHAAMLAGFGYMRHMLNCAIHDTRKELARRGAA